MEFKLTKWKTIISLILGAGGGFLYAFLRVRIASLILGVEGGFLRSFFTMERGVKPTIYPWIFSGIIIAVVIYLIWSFIQKKKK